MTDLSRGKELDPALGKVGIAPDEYPALPDAIMADPRAGRLDPRAWFAEPARAFEIEIGCGKGGFILAQAESDPATNYLGIEWAHEYYVYTADRIRRRGLSNVRMLHANASDFLHWRCPDAVARVIHLYFSDPWPKSKHHKNRVVQHRFLADAWRCLTPGGELRVVTDHDELWEWDQHHFEQWSNAQDRASEHWPAGSPNPPFAQLAFSPPAWVGEGELVGTNYERKMCVDRGPHAAVLQRLDVPARR